jgi:hypothetical protein
MRSSWLRRPPPSPRSVNEMKEIRMKKLLKVKKKPTGRPSKKPLENKDQAFYDQQLYIHNQRIDQLVMAMTCVERALQGVEGTVEAVINELGEMRIERRVDKTDNKTDKWRIDKWGRKERHDG